MKMLIGQIRVKTTLSNYCELSNLKTFSMFFFVDYYVFHDS